MTPKTVPRYLALTATLSLVVGGLMLIVFYGQYRWMSMEMIEVSVRQFETAQSAAFERRARGRMQRIADAIALHTVVAETPDVVSVMRAAVAGDSDIVSIRYQPPVGTVVSASRTGSDAGAELAEAGSDVIDLSIAVNSNTESLGTLYMRFDLTDLHGETATFRDMLLTEDAEHQAISLTRVVAIALFGMLLCAAVVGLVVRSQTRRIRELQAQVTKLSDSNFGEPLDVERPDEIGELAHVFNEMRDRLQETTVSRDYMDKMLSGMNEAIIVTDDEGRITRINNATTRMLGYDEADLVGQSIESIVESTKSGRIQSHSQESIPDEAKMTTKFGELVPVSYTGSVIRSQDGTSQSRIFAAQNITERRKQEKRIRYLARIDALTKVPNRMQFQHLLQRSIARAKKANRSLALFYIDVDHFKEINDTFGHLAGDTTLETVAARLKESLPDDCTIGRLAGDEFAVIVDRLRPSKETIKQLDKLARKSLNKLADPFYVQGHEVFMTASMGIACYPIDGTNVIDLIRNADAALYHAKKAGGNVSAYYKPEMNQTAVERLMTKSKLKRAFERDELLVRYQPRYNIETGNVVGAEALVRWELPERGIILPADFIPLAEETNLIIEIGEWVLDRVCEDFRYWQRSVSSPGRVSVNLSLKQLRQSNFISRISGILRSYELSPTSLELEITETTLMENPVRTVKILDELYSLGLHLSIDDFGTGYSSLSALQQFPISTLKIDKSFVRDVAIDTDDATIVGTIIQMGKSLNMEVVAEGVESEEQLGYLQNLGCTFVQGLLFGSPMSSDNYLELVLAQAEGTDKYRALFA